MTGPKFRLENNSYLLENVKSLSSEVIQVYHIGFWQVDSHQHQVASLYSHLDHVNEIIVGEVDLGRGRAPNPV